MEFQIVGHFKQVLEFFINGGVLPKHVGVNKELYWYIRWAYVGFINEKFGQNARNEECYQKKVHPLYFFCVMKAGLPRVLFYSGCPLFNA